MKFYIILLDFYTFIYEFDTKEECKEKFEELKKGEYDSIEIIHGKSVKKVNKTKHDDWYW